MITTALTKLLNIRVPVVLAPMAGVSGGMLAAAVTKAGGFGFIAAGTQPIPKLLSEISLARTSLSLGTKEPLPFGIGIMLFKLESLAGNPSLFEPFLTSIMAEKPKAIWLAFGAGLKIAVDRIRELEKEGDGENGEGGRRNVIFVMVQNTKQGIEVAGWDIDVVVAQGTESGGHGPSFSAGLPLISLLPLLHSHFQTLPSPPLLIAAGGISTGLQLLSILPFSSGAVIGTGFLCTPESLYSDQQKELLIKSEGEDTIRTERFDLARGSLMGWGEGVDGRGIKNLISLEDGRGEIELVKDYNDAAKVGDVERIVTWAGTSVGQIKKIETADEIINRIEKECEEGIKVLSGLMV